MNSGVEGRGGELNRHHHGRHRLSDRKLAALHAVHNYHIRRTDGTTAAERFFGCADETLFAQVLQRMPLLPRPARRRPRSPKQPYLIHVATAGVAGTMIKAQGSKGVAEPELLRHFQEAFNAEFVRAS